MTENILSESVVSLTQNDVIKKIIDQRRNLENSLRENNSNSSKKDISSTLKLIGSPFKPSISLASKMNKFFSKSKISSFGEEKKKKSLLGKMLKVGFGLGVASFIGYVTLTTPLKMNYTFGDFQHNWLQNLSDVSQNVYNHFIYSASRISDIVGFSKNAVSIDPSLTHNWTTSEINSTSIPNLIKAGHGTLPHDVFQKIIEISPKDPITVDGATRWDINWNKMNEIGKITGIHFGKTPSLESLNTARHFMSTDDFITFVKFTEEASRRLVVR